MRFALRTAACCATIVAALWPTKAIGDEAALKRTAPDECIAWFSWAGLDALAKDGPKTNRTEQLLADEEVRAFLDSIAKNLDGAIKVGDDENTKHCAQLFRVLSKRPAVAFLTRIAEVKREAPPKAPEPAAPPPIPPQAAVLPTMKVTIGEDGLERIGVDFDVEVTAGDLPAARSAASAITPAVAEQLEVQVAPASPPRFGRTRKTIVDGKPRTEVEVHYPHGTEWQEIELNVDLDPTDGQSTANDKPTTEEELAELVRKMEADIAQAAAVPSPNPPPAIRPPSPDPRFASNSGAVFAVPVTPSATAPLGLELPPPPAPPVCTTCTSCEMSCTTTVVHGAVIVDLGDHFAETKALYDKLAAEGSELPKQKIADVEFAKLAWDQPMYLAFQDAYLILAFDEASAEQCASGLAGKREAPKWLVDAESKLPIERPAARLHVNIDGITKLVDEPFEEPSQELVKLLGLDQVSAISFAAGLDDRGTAIKTLIATRDGANVSAVLDFFGDKGLAAEDLKAIPKDATMAAAGKIDAKKIVDLGLKIARLDDDQAESDWDATKKYLAEHLFIDLSKDIVEALGDTWTLHYAPSEGGLMATTFTLAVRDEARLKTALEKLALVANADDAYVRKFTYRGQDVYYWQGGDSGGSAAWCIRDGRLVASLLPQTIKAHIARGPLKETLADVPEVERCLADGDNATKNLVLSYTDTRGILQWCYQYGSFLLPTIGQQLAQADECTLALHDFPSLAVIEQYFAPSITTVSRTDAGLLIDSRQTVPMISGLMAMSVLSGIAGVEDFVVKDDGADVLASVNSVAEAPVHLLAESFGGVFAPSEPVLSSGECVSVPCGTYPATLPPPHAVASPPVAYPAPTTPRSEPGPWTPAAPPPPLPPTPHAGPMPYGTPVPYYVPNAVGQSYVAPTTTAPTFPPAHYPAALPSTSPAPAAVPAPPNVPLSVPAGKLGQGKPAAIGTDPGDASAYATPAASYPPAPLAPPVAATYADPNVTRYSAPVASPMPSPPGSNSTNWLNPYATAPVARAESPAKESPASEAAPAKPAADAKPAPNARPSRRLFRRRAAAASESFGAEQSLADAKIVSFSFFVSGGP